MKSANCSFYTNYKNTDKGMFGEDYSLCLVSKPDLELDVDKFGQIPIKVSGGKGKPSKIVKRGDGIDYFFALKRRADEGLNPDTLNQLYVY